MKKFYKILEKDFINNKNIEISTQRVEEIIKKLKVKPLIPIHKTINDKTKIHYSGIVIDNKKNKYFLKIKLIDDPLIDNLFNKNRVLGRIFKRNNSYLSINKYTPRLLDDDKNFLLYEYFEGESMGSRKYYNVFKFKMKDLPQILDIIKAIHEFPIKLLSKNYEKCKDDFYFFYIYKLHYNRSIEEEFNSYLNKKELKFIQDLKNNSSLKELVKRNIKFLNHGDFQAVNFLKKNNHLNIVDWDMSSITLKYYDIAKFFHTSYRKISFNRIFLENIFNKFTSTTEEKILLLFSLLALAFDECRIIINNLNPYFKKLKHNNKIFMRRITDLKKFINQLSSIL